MFNLHFTNVVCSAEGQQFATLDLAIAGGRKAGFEFTVQQDGNVVASWSVFGGLRYPMNLNRA